MPELKDHGMNITVSSLISMVTLGTMVWFVLQPVMVSQMSLALADEMEDQIETKTKPISNAFKVLLQSDISRLKRNIAILDRRKTHDPDNFSEADAVRLADYEIELEAFEEAIDDLD